MSRKLVGFRSVTRSGITSGISMAIDFIEKNEMKLAIQTLKALDKVYGIKKDEIVKRKS